MFRYSLLIAAVAVVLVGFTLPTQAQQAPAPNPSALLAAQPDLDSGVYDLTAVYARAAGAIRQDQLAYVELLVTRSRLETELHLSPEYKTAAAELEQAHDALDAARKPVLASVAGDPRYQELSGKYQNVAAVLADGGLSQRDVHDLAARKMEYGSEMRRMESAALNADAAVQSARTNLIAAQRKVDDQVELFQATLYKNPQWAQAKQAYDHSEVTVAAAGGAVYGANVTACLAIAADVRHSVYSNSNFNDFGSFGLFDSGSYYGRRY